MRGLNVDFMKSQSNLPKYFVNQNIGRAGLTFNRWHTATNQGRVAGYPRRKKREIEIIDCVILPLVKIDGGVHRVAMSVSKPRVGESLSEKF